jgi:DNA polymerase-4
MIFERRYLPQSLYSLELDDIPGIGKRMEQRILAEGITTMRQLCALTRERMHTIWGGVLGDRLWLWLRGEDFLELPARPLQTLSRQHILPPDCRTPDKARGVALKLLHSTARKMRRNDLWAGGLSLQVGFYDHVAFGRRCACRNRRLPDSHGLRGSPAAPESRSPCSRWARSATASACSWHRR